MLKSICSRRLIKPRGLFSGVRTFYLLLVSRYFLLVAPYFLLATFYSLLVTFSLITRYFLLVTCYYFLVTFYSLLVALYLLLVTFYSVLVTTYSLPFTLLFIRHYLLVTHCLLFWFINFYYLLAKLWKCLDTFKTLNLLNVNNNNKKTRRTIVITAYIPFELKSGNVTARRGTNMLILTSHQL